MKFAIMYQAAYCSQIAVLHGYSKHRVRTWIKEHKDCCNFYLVIPEVAL